MKVKIFVSAILMASMFCACGNNSGYVKAATESLKQEFYKLSEKLYQQAQAAQGEAAQGGDSDVVDGDGKEI